MSSDRALLEVRNLTVDYVGEHSIARAVNGIDFDIREGEAFGLAGESGCGKSTVAFALARLTRLPGLVSGGEVRLNGENVLKFDKARLKAYRWNEVSFVFQSAMNALNPVIPVAEQITDVIETHNPALGADGARARAEELFELVGIPPARLGDFSHQFSGGMRQRICIAIALALNPRLIIMDEPTTALDVVVQRDIIEQIVDLKAKLGFSVLFITHDLGLMIEFCDRIGIMYSGELVEVAPSEAILTNALHPYTRALGNSFPPLTGPRLRMEGIPGSPPDLRSLPQGCRFAPRCPHAMDICRVENPELRLYPEHRSQAACHLLN
ncbi:ABC transporter ATP-binding protein [Devosia sp. Leaf64]|uniref:ABC transporter ATP-binding protein n=1 Tax=Devosia sp. Leaf64 TaxID=1736229 RepID=UPI000715D792|nr:ABC transporter ATP-binding protein [Devosia sp. Leaf64]KQN72502.1 sugar ABC transporter ATP-binding protein [Devosia sp. Leaf64]